MEILLVLFNLREKIRNVLFRVLATKKTVFTCDSKKETKSDEKRA